MTDHPDSVRDFMEHQTKIDIIGSHLVQRRSQRNGLRRARPQRAARRQAAPHGAISHHLHLRQNRRPQPAHQRQAPDRHDRLADLRVQAEWLRVFQLDFEDISWTDRDALSATVKRIADTMHREHLQLQIAVVPNAPGHPGHGAFSKWIFADWRGVFDRQALSQSVDLICLMTYDQHTLDHARPGGRMDVDQ
jgi:hypothetical protein